MKQHGIVALIFIIGCAAGGVASQLVIPPARAGTNPTRWEYLCQQGNAALTSSLNGAGLEGWELVNVLALHQSVVSGMSGEIRTDLLMTCFKRALP